MTSEEIKTQIEALSEKCFILDMKDFWSNKDFETYNKWTEEIRELKAQLKEE